MIETHCLRTDGQITVIMTCRAAFTATNIVNSGHRVAYEGLSLVASLSPTQDLSAPSPESRTLML